MTLRPAIGALATALLLAVAACGPAGVSLEAEGATTQPALTEWANQQFNEERWGEPGVHQGAGGIGPGSDGGLEFTPGKAGWYAIGMACEGAESIAVTVTVADGDLGTGNTSCGSEVRTTMELPASKVTIAVEGAEDSGMWALAVTPADAP
ncbi:hypothetical protein [Arthrobacter sp. Marseille-P9274]|uniref:hypothetical protein n=1 Tax=Arthrobacter sp. Marseille-P9274 TaxID=2866572 RepID=UPI0021C86F44|nr:hypothetical protein [Arthrobacter sp. Marseille-P9274]